MFASAPCHRHDGTSTRYVADSHGIDHVSAMKAQATRCRISRELAAIAAVALLSAVYLSANWETRSPSFMVGRVSGFGLVEQKEYGQIGSVLRARVELPGHQAVSISLPNESTCRVGSQIQVEEAHTLVGSRFKAGMRGCSRTVFSAEKP